METWDEVGKKFFVLLFYWTDKNSKLQIVIQFNQLLILNKYPSEFYMYIVWCKFITQVECESRDTNI